MVRGSHVRTAIRHSLPCQHAVASSDSKGGRVDAWLCPQRGSIAWSRCVAACMLGAAVRLCLRAVPGRSVFCNSHGCRAVHMYKERLRSGHMQVNAQDQYNSGRDIISQVIARSELA
eukprot:jgi/Ulvmu1/12875/UM098_0063.1